MTQSVFRGNSSKPLFTDDCETVIDADYVVSRLEEAGAAVLALHGCGWITQLRSSSIVRAAPEAYRPKKARIWGVIPSDAKIDRMDEALCWLLYIPQDRYILRHIVGARSLVHPSTNHHLFTWRRLSVVLGQITKPSNSGMPRGWR